MRDMPLALKPVGSQKIALNSTAQALNSTSQTASVLDLSVETQAARYDMSGNVTANTGVLLAANTHWRMERYNGTSMLKFCAATSGAVLNVQAYKYATEA